VSSSVVIRAAIEADMARLIVLMSAHAEYEGASFDAAGLDHRLRTTLLNQTRSSCLVAVSDDCEIVGYSTYTPDYATWVGRDFVHMDTLFVDQGARGRGIGRLLIEAVIERAAISGFAEVQWQTPDWNHNAIRFYERLGATHSAKARFTYRMPTDRRTTHVDVLDTFTAAWGTGNTSLLRSCLHDDAVYRPSVSVAGAPFVGIESVLVGIATMRMHDANSVVEFGPCLETPTTITRTWVYHFGDRPSEYGVDIFRFADGLIVAKDAFRRQ
jgi:GNAT superfamily N-acetyltransferase